MAALYRVRGLERAAARLDQALRGASRYALRYGVGWDRVREPQGLSLAYETAIHEARDAGRPVAAEEWRAA